MLATEITLGDFVKQLAVAMEHNGLVMLFKNEKPWHLLFYDLKRDAAGEGKPSFFESLRFDWNGPYPKSQELSRFIQALHWTGAVGAVNPSYEKLVLQEDVSRLWGELAADMEQPLRRYLQRAVQIARTEFPSQAAAD